MTFREVDNMIYAIMQEDEAAIKREEREMKLHYELARLSSFWNVSPHMDRKNRLKAPTDLIRYPWEVDHTSQKMSDDDIKKILRKWYPEHYKKKEHGT